MYNLHHCDASANPTYNPHQVYDTSKILAGEACYFQTSPVGPQYENCWGHRFGAHWWGQPALGYYCQLDANSTVFTQHAIKLRDAGVDFVVVDFSNLFHYDSNHPGNAAQTSYGPAYHQMLTAWSQVSGAPKIVPFFAVTGTITGTYASSSNSTIDRLALDKLFLEFRSSQMWFMYQGKPLVIVLNNLSFAPDATRVSGLEQTNNYDRPVGGSPDGLIPNGFTTRKMWARFEFADPAVVNTTTYPDMPSWWSFSEQCKPGFKANSGNSLCDQGVAVRDGQVEQVSLTAGYGECARNPQTGGIIDFSCAASHTSTAVPKWGGKTVLSQLQTVRRNPSTQIVIITAWNGWVNQRFCLDEACAGSDEFPDTGTKIFHDEYNADYNSTFEPGGPQGDLHYKILRSAITTLKPDTFQNGKWGVFPNNPNSSDPGTFNFGLTGDIPFVAQLTVGGPYVPLVFRRTSSNPTGFAYWYVNRATDAQGFYSSWNPALTDEVQFGWNSDVPKLVYMNGAYHIAVYRPSTGETLVSTTNTSFNGSNYCVLGTTGCLGQ